MHTIKASATTTIECDVFCPICEEAIGVSGNLNDDEYSYRNEAYFITDITQRLHNGEPAIVKVDCHNCNNSFWVNIERID